MNLYEIIEGMKYGEISLSVGSRMIKVLLAQAKVATEEVEVATRGMVVEGRSLELELNSASLSDEDVI